MSLIPKKKLKFFQQNKNVVLSVLLLAGIVFSFVRVVLATTPDPGHDFTSIGGGVAQGNILYGSAADTLLALAKDANATRYLSNQGASNNPSWNQVNLANGVTGTLADGSIASALTGKTYNALTLTALGTGFSVAGGTVSKTLTVTGDATISGTPLSNPMTTLGDIVYGGAAGVATRLGGAAGFLKSTGAAIPAWSTINLAASADVGATILTVPNGGTGAATLTGVVIGNGASAFTVKTNPTGAFVGDTDTQTLSGKTMTGLNLTAGTTAVDPVTFNSGPLLTTPVAGSIEFLTDAFYGTITTGPARKTFAFLEGPTFTGVPSAPTAATGTNTTQLATTAFAEAAIPNASYRVIAQASGSHIAAKVAGTYLMGDGDPLAVSGTGTLYPIKIIHIAAADYPTVDGKTAKLKLKVNLAVNDVAPTGNYTFGLYPITRPATSGGTGLDIYTAGTVTASSTVLFTAPAVDSLQTGSSSDFALPADGFYAIGVLTTATVANSSHLHMAAYLMMRNN